jgi:hypothetical protein
MPWGRPPEILTNDVYCPYCAKEGKKQKLACEIHSWAYRKWYVGEQDVFGRYAVRGFFAKPKEK